MFNNSFLSKIKKFFSNSNKDEKIVKINDIDNLEKLLLSADIGTDITVKILKNLEEKILGKRIKLNDLNGLLKNEIINFFVKKKDSIENKIKNCNNPYVCTVVGVNGVGKTTTVGKLAFLFKEKGFNPIIGASDTFRECAIDQLEIWANKAKVPLVKQKINSDPASVAYDTIQSAKSKNKDVVIIDTAGRLHNKTNLMKELSKINRVMKKIIPEAPHETILVLDSTNGQNSFDQTKKFISFVHISCIILTKLDGTAKGGFVVNIMNNFNIPIQYVGVGEKINDLKEFDEKKFINDFFSK